MEKSLVKRIEDTRAGQIERPATEKVVSVFSSSFNMVALDVDRATSFLFYVHRVDSRFLLVRRNRFPKFTAVPGHDFPGPVPSIE